MTDPFSPKEIGAIVTAYTGVVLGHFSDTHEYAERVLGRPVWTHMFADESIVEELKKATEPDFMRLNAWIRGEDRPRLEGEK
jgi:hypothetical protein